MFNRGVMSPFIVYRMRSRFDCTRPKQCWGINVAGQLSHNSAADWPGLQHAQLSRRCHRSVRGGLRDAVGSDLGPYEAEGWLVRLWIQILQRTPGLHRAQYCGEVTMCLMSAFGLYPAASHASS